MPTVEHRTEYERQDVSPKIVAGLAGGFGLLIAVTLVLLRFSYPQAIGDGGGKGPRKPLAAEPRLQVAETPDLALLRQAEELRLSRYGWVDQSAGIAHLPISDAIRITARKGLPGWTKAER